MAMRKCDGTDMNLTREIPREAFNQDIMRLSHWDGILNRPATRIIACNCGLEFDDTYRRVIWPHEAVPRYQRAC